MKGKTLLLILLPLILVLVGLGVYVLKGNKTQVSSPSIPKVSQGKSKPASGFGVNTSPSATPEVTKSIGDLNDELLATVDDGGAAEMKELQSVANGL